MEYTFVMATRDDEDVWVSSSRQEKFTRADARADILKREIEEKQGRKILDKDAKCLKNLKTKVNLQSLQAQVSDERKRAKQAEEDKRKKPFHTETIREKEEKSIQTAQDQPDADKMIKKEEDKREEQAQAGQEYQQQVG